MNGTSWVGLRNDGGAPILAGASGLRVTIRGVAYPHRLFEWVLSYYSRWTYVSLALSETFEVPLAGLQRALRTLGAVPSLVFRAAAYGALGRTQGERAEVAAYVRLPHLAATTDERRGGDASRPARRRRMTAPTTQVTTLLMQFGLTTAARGAVHAARRALQAPFGDGDEQRDRAGPVGLPHGPVAAEGAADACTARSCTRPVAAPETNRTGHRARRTTSPPRARQFAGPFPGPPHRQ